MISIIYDIAKLLIFPNLKKWWKRRGKRYFLKLTDHLHFRMILFGCRMRSVKWDLYWKFIPVIAFFKGGYKFQERWIEHE
jgi:hypothetical protein